MGEFSNFEVNVCPSGTFFKLQSDTLFIEIYHIKIDQHNQEYYVVNEVLLRESLFQHAASPIFMAMNRNGVTPISNKNEVRT